MHKPLRERVRLAEAARADASSGRMRIQVLTPGWGTSGYYSQEVCEAAVGLVKAGTQMYIDHPTESEQVERPARSIRDIGAVITEDGTWDADLGAVVAECKPIAPYKEVLTDLKDHIGLSIRGSATDIYEGEAEGRRGPIIEGLADIASVDFVTRAGRGGKILQLLESARHDIAEAVSDKAWSDFSDSDYDDAQYARACILDRGEDAGTAKKRYSVPVKEPSGTLNRNGCHAAATALGGGRGGVSASSEQKMAAAKKLVSLYRNQLNEDPPESLLKAAGMSSEEADRRIAEATSDERREQLSAAVGTAYGDRDRWVWVRDFDDSTVWFHLSDRGEDVGHTYEQSYTVADNDMAVTLTGERTEVRSVTKYVPVSDSTTEAAKQVRLVADVEQFGEALRAGRVQASELLEVLRKKGHQIVPVSPAGQSTTEESEEDTMGKIQVEEAEHRRLTEIAGRVETLESERDTAVRERDEARRERDTGRAREAATTRARKRISEANGNLHSSVVDRIVREATRDIPLTDKGELDEATFDTATDKAREAEESYLTGLAEAAGAGTVKGLGQSTTTTTGEVTEADVNAAVAGAFGRSTTKVKEG